MEIEYQGGPEGVKIEGKPNEYSTRVKFVSNKGFRVTRPTIYEPILLSVTVGGRHKEITVPAAPQFKIQTYSFSNSATARTGYGRDWGPAQICANLDDVKKRDPETSHRLSVPGAEAVMLPGKVSLETTMEKSAGTYFAGDCQKGIKKTGRCKDLDKISEDERGICAHFYAHGSDAGSAANAVITIRGRYMLVTPLADH